MDETLMMLSAEQARLEMSITNLKILATGEVYSLS